MTPKKRWMETLTRADGATIKCKTECWQHDPYVVYLPVSVRQWRRLENFRTNSKPVKREDGNWYATKDEPLRWGNYGAKVVARVTRRD